MLASCDGVGITCPHTGMSQTCTGPKTQRYFEVSSDGQIFVHAQSTTALPIWSLNNTEMFLRWDFYEHGTRTRPTPWIPKADFENMVRAVIPEYDPETWILSVQEMTKAKGYARPSTFSRAIEKKQSICGSEYHFVQVVDLDDATAKIWATTISSLNAVDVRDWTRQREHSNAEKCKNILMTSVGATSIATATAKLNRDPKP
jgi:hypothetical protein